MIAPTIPVDEAQRLDKVRALRILDTDKEERFDRLTRMARKMFGVDIALVTILDEGRQWFKSRDTDKSLPDETSRDISFCGHAILGDDLFVIEDALADARFKDNPLVTGLPNIRFYAGFPIRIDGGSGLGTLCLIDKNPRSFDLEDRQLLTDLGSMVQQEIAAQREAYTDELTGVANRRGFFALAQYALNACQRSRLPSSMVLLDLDKFKTINDQYGHAEGDQVLLTFATLARQVFRSSDIVGRLGGDEFCVYMIDADESDTRNGIIRFRDALDEHNRELGRDYAICFSAGYVMAQPDHENAVADLIAKADASMYSAKQKAPG